MDLSSMSGVIMEYSDDSAGEHDSDYENEDDDLHGNPGRRSDVMSLDDSHNPAAGSSASNAAADAAALTRAAQTALLSGNGEGHVTITGNGCAQTASKKTYTVYIISVRALNGAAWTVYRRYSQFKALSEKIHLRMNNRLQMRVKELLPPKKMIGSFDPEFISRRQKALAKWLNQLMDAFRRINMPPFNDEDLRFFVTHDANKPPRDLKISTNTINSSDKNSGDASSTGVVGSDENRLGPEGQMEHALNAAGTASSRSRDVRTGKQVSLEDFEMIKVIGKGSFGKVLLVRKRDSRNLFAMKVLDKKNIIRRNQVEHTNTERRVLGQIRHPFIVTLHFAFQTRTRLYFVLDYCSGGELFFHLGRCGRLRESLACFYAAEITLALAHLHSLGIVYRDLKPENILLDGDGHVRLADFGLSKEGITTGTSGTGSFCGTAEYLAPEILNRTGHGTGVDWWALGMVLYEMLTGMPPWYTKEREVLFERVRRSPLEFPKHVSPNAKSIIQGFLVRDSAKRIGVRLGAQEVMAQPFFSHIDWKALYERRLSPPFRPRKDVGSLDASNFDKVFTRMRIEVPTGPSSIAGSNTFAGFSFEGHFQDRRQRERQLAMNNASSVDGE